MIQQEITNINIFGYPKLNYEDFITSHNILITPDGYAKYTNLQTGKKVNKKISLDYDKIHKQIKENDCNFLFKKYACVYSKNIENYRMIAFSFMFYYLFVTENKIPSLDMLINSYLDTFCVNVENDLYKIKEEYVISYKNIYFAKKEIAGRIARAYQSFIREIELLSKLYKYLPYDISYNLKADLVDGIDIIVTTKENVFGLATYLDNKRTRMYKNKKNVNRHNYNNNMIDVKAITHGENKNTIQLGTINVYNNDVINYIKNEINKLQTATKIS